MSQINYRRTLNIILAESILTYSGIFLCIPIMTVFWNDIGMDQFMIGVSQMVCAATLFLFDVPMGYFADRFSRKALNVIGDAGITATFIFYAFAQNFWMVVVGEILCGLFMAMTGGVDRAFLKIYSDKIDSSGELFKKKTAQLAVWQIAVMCLSIIIGMFIAKYSIRLTIFAVAVPFLAAAVLALQIKDIGQKIEARHKNHLKDMIINFKYVIKNAEIKWLVYSYAIGIEITHPIIWALTPLLVMTGVPVWLVGTGWILWYGVAPLGTLLARKTTRLNTSAQIFVPLTIVTLASLPVIISPNLITIWLFPLSGVAYGIVNIYIMPKLQQKTEEKYQTTVVSIASSAARLIYIPIVLITNYFGNTAPQYILLATVLIFAPLTLLAFVKLRGFERGEK
ncbi:MAG: MFS transporter [Oscillospiraceae bacterium]|nr:MFS transporter [Oscillospiraceae bacterium]